MTLTDQEIAETLDGHGDTFIDHLIRAIHTATENDRRKLGEAYPSEMMAYLRFMQRIDAKMV